MYRPITRTAIRAAVLLFIALLPCFVRGQQSNASDKRAAQAAQTKAPSPEDAEIQRLKEERQRLLKQKEIEKLRKENEQLESGADKPATTLAPPPAKVLSPEDAELQRLEEERKRLLKQQEIERLRKQNEALQAPPVLPVQPPPVPPAQTQKPPANCTPQAQQGPTLKAQVPPKASAWACKTIGICSDNKPIVLNPPDNGCPTSPTK